MGIPALPREQYRYKAGGRDCKTTPRSRRLTEDQITDIYDDQMYEDDPRAVRKLSLGR